MCFPMTFAKFYRRPFLIEHLRWLLLKIVMSISGLIFACCLSRQYGLQIIWQKGATKLYFTHYSCVVIVLFNTGLYKSVFSTYSFGRQVFLSFCAFSVCFEFKVIFINFYNICIITIHIVGVRFSCSHVSLSHLNNLWKQITS